MNPTFIRTGVFFSTFILIVVLPWWLSVPILLLSTLYFPLYLEVLFFGFVFDVLYLAQYSFPYTGLTLATLFLLVTIFVKTRIKDF